MILTKEEIEYVKSQCNGVETLKTLTVVEFNWEFLIDEINDYRVVIFNDYERGQYGHSRLGYIFSFAGKIIFKGYDLETHLMSGSSFKETLIPIEIICFFFGRDLNDMEDEQIASKTPDELEWLKEHGDVLGQFASCLLDHINNEDNDSESDCLVIPSFYHKNYGEPTKEFSGFTLDQLDNAFE